MAKNETITIQPIRISNGTGLAVFRQDRLVDAATQPSAEGRDGLSRWVWHVIYGTARRLQNEHGGEIVVCPHPQGFRVRIIAIARVSARHLTALPET